MSTVVRMDDIVKKVLSVGNKEQNQHWPPHIISEQFNTVSNFIIDRCVELFPGNNGIVDIIKPFLIKKQVAVVGGIIPFPENYRNLLGAAITVTKDLKSLCSDAAEYKNDPLKKTVAQMEREKTTGNCISNIVTMVDQDEWDERTTSNYKKPTYKKPIGCIFEGEGIRVCPYDIGHVELRYVREPKEYRYGYTQLPDDTFVFDPTVSEESEWNKTATAYLFKGMSSLYSIYLRDTEMRNWNTELKNIGLL